MNDALLLVACNFPDQVPGIVMSVFMMGVGIYFLYRAWRGIGIPFRRVLRRDRVLWTRILERVFLCTGR